MMKKTVYAVLSVMFVAFLAMTSCGSSQSAAQKQAKAQEIRQKIEDSRFTFNATYAYPTGFRSIYLSPYYNLKVSRDTVEAYLPYYGRAYTAPINPSEGGIKFTSTKFDYKVSEGKRKGSWIIAIKPNATERDLSLFLEIWENGSARLDVSSSDRQPISFQGEIE